MGKSRWTLFIFKSHTAFLKIIRIPSCWSFFVGLHQRQIVKQPTVPLLCCYISSLLLAQWESEILKGRKTAIELRWYRQRRCRLPMMYEVRRSVHQRAGRLLLHPETPLSPSVTSPSEDPSPTLLPHFYTSQPLFSLFFFFTVLAFWMFIDPPLLFSLPVDQELKGLLAHFPYQPIFTQLELQNPRLLSDVCIRKHISYNLMWRGRHSIRETRRPTANRYDKFPRHLDGFIWVFSCFSPDGHVDMKILMFWNDGWEWEEPSVCALLTLIFFFCFPHFCLSSLSWTANDSNFSHRWPQSCEHLSTRAD